MAENRGHGRRTKLTKWGIQNGHQRYHCNNCNSNFTHTRADISILFKDIIDSFSKAPINEAVKNDWIKPITFLNEERDYSSYYDGKAALPIHIAQNLPVKRPTWERKVEALLVSSDAIIIKSSSGQGKSTLAWQACFNNKEIYSIYQVHYCPDYNTANAINQFIQSRLSIGQLPLIVFDGLNSSLNGWNYVVEGTTSLPVKFIITSRNEDWYRYGSDVFKSNIQFIDLNLSREEAKYIYDQLHRKGKLNIKDSWQAIWEQVQEKGLLIEYVYLLTRGQMIHDRLAYQIYSLNQTKGAASKLEILRLISLADIMNVKIRTKMLIKYVADNIGFESDRGEVLNELANEYFINFDSIYIAGLHPVKSKHLVSILHQNLPIEDSLISLYKLLDDIYFSDYFINVPLLLNDKNKESFYSELGALLSDGSFHQMVLALDGIFHVEPQIYWRNNKQIYDEASTYGSVELFSMTTIPFAEQAVSQLDDLSELLKESDGFRQLAILAKKLPKFTMSRTDVFILATSIKTGLERRTNEIDTYLGFGSLTKWFSALNIVLTINPNILSRIRINRFFDNIESFELNEAKDIVSFYLISDRNEYLRHSSLQRSKLISYLKKETNSLTILEKENDVHINYILYGDDVSNANEQSVERIQTIYTFLPVYDKYCTEAIMLPIPSEELISVARNNSVKHMPPENIGDEFGVHLNQIWHTTILKNYEAASVYEWQKSIIELREAAVDLVLSLCQYVDSLLEGNSKKSQSSLLNLNKHQVLFQKLDLGMNPYPSFNLKYQKYGDKTKKEKDINSWLSSLRNVNNQMLNLFIPEGEHSRHVALYNLKATYQSVYDMQACFNSIVSESYEYINTSELELKEHNQYERLHMTMQYYVSQLPLETKPAVKVAKNVAKEWWVEQARRKIEQLNGIIENANKIKSYNHG